MKSNSWIERLSKPFRLTRWDVGLVLIPAILWPILVQLRPVLIDTRCIDAAVCPSTEIPAWDQPGFYLEKPKADLYSLYTQNASGAVLLTGILFTIPAGLPTFLTHLVLGIEATLWNGMVTESIRLLAQRPRPFVYQNPAGDGPWAANYVSFYSGHTSFAMAANLMLFFILLARRSHPLILLLAMGVGQCLVISTAIYRVLAGRHFISDTWGGMLGATLVITTLVWFHSRSNEKT